MNIQYGLIPPLVNKSETYYEKKITQTIEEIQILLDNNKIASLIITIYDLIDEYDRITKEIIIQKKRIDSCDFLNEIKNKLKLLKTKKNIEYRLFRAIKENETKDELLNWINTIGNFVADSFVFVGNYKNKNLTTNIALEYIIKNNLQNKKYGSVVIFHRNDEYNRCLKRINLGVSFFSSQIIVDDCHTKNTNKIFNLDIPIFVTITPIFSKNIWIFLKSLGVSSHNNFITPNNEKHMFEHLLKMIKFIINNNKNISFELLTHNNIKRRKQLVKFSELL